MPTSTLTSKGQITLPKEIRDLLGLRAGDRIRFRAAADGTVVLEPETGCLLDLFGALSPPGGRHLTVEEMNEAIRHAASRRRTGR